MVGSFMFEFTDMKIAEQSVQHLMICACASAS